MAKRKRHRKGSKAIVRYRTRTVTRVRRVGAHRKHRRSRRRGQGGVQLLPLAIAAAGVGFLAGQDSPIKAIPDNIGKIPGAKTFGNEAMFGLACLAVNKWVKPNKWLKLAGIAGLTLAAFKIGSQGKNFKFVGGDDDLDGLDSDDVGDDDDGMVADVGDEDD